eukprot:g7309.t1
MATSASGFSGSTSAAPAYVYENTQWVVCTFSSGGANPDSISKQEVNKVEPLASLVFPPDFLARKFVDAELLDGGAVCAGGTIAVEDTDALIVRAEALPAWLRANAEANGEEPDDNTSATRGAAGGAGAGGQLSEQEHALGFFRRTFPKYAACCEGASTGAPELLFHRLSSEVFQRRFLDTLVKTAMLEATKTGTYWVAPADEAARREMLTYRLECFRHCLKHSTIRDELYGILFERSVSDAQAPEGEGEVAAAVRQKFYDAVYGVADEDAEHQEAGSGGSAIRTSDSNVEVRRLLHAAIQKWLLKASEPATNDVGLELGKRPAPSPPGASCRHDEVFFSMRVVKQKEKPKPDETHAEADDDEEDEELASEMFDSEDERECAELKSKKNAEDDDGEDQDDDDLISEFRLSDADYREDAAGQSKSSADPSFGGASNNLNFATLVDFLANEILPRHYLFREKIVSSTKKKLQDFSLEDLWLGKHAGVCSIFDPFDEEETLDQKFRIKTEGSSGSFATHTKAAPANKTATAPSAMSTASASPFVPATAVEEKLSTELQKHVAAKDIANVGKTLQCVVALPVADRHLAFLRAAFAAAKPLYGPATASSAASKNEKKRFNRVLNELPILIKELEKEVRQKEMERDRERKIADDEGHQRAAGSCFSHAASRSSGSSSSPEKMENNNSQPPPAPPTSTLESRMPLARVLIQKALAGGSSRSGLKRGVLKDKILEAAGPQKLTAKAGFLLLDDAQRHGWMKLQKREVVVCDESLLVDALSSVGRSESEALLADAAFIRGLESAALEKSKRREARKEKRTKKGGAAADVARKMWSENVDEDEAELLIPATKRARKIV